MSTVSLPELRPGDVVAVRRVRRDVTTTHVALVAEVGVTGFSTPSGGFVAVAPGDTIRRLDPPLSARAKEVMPNV